jgi:hypothetical protein
VKVWRAIFLAIAVVFVFLAGVGLGEALHDNPDDTGTQTLVRTLQPLPLAPAARSTVTITVSEP